MKNDNKVILTLGRLYRLLGLYIHIIIQANLLTVNTHFLHKS